MAKSVLIISSSPRRQGNSDRLCDSFRQGAEKAGNRVEKVNLADLKYQFCSGCGSCESTHSCVYQDDIAKVAEKMLAADVIVLASPVYFYAVCGQLKTFLDRMLPYYQQISNKDFYYLFTAADSDPAAMDTAAGEMRSFLACLDNCHEKGMVRGTGAYEKGSITDTPHPEEAYFMGTSV
jgi:multimeric flavodoxin WrbA